ncbi:ATP-binding protein [Nocardia sp. PE-7]|uniref:ATP-binding protein n=1 Tax=Nocardia sp. PE-7 TaxID=3058426 RepID=UPI00265B3C63|nr:ATP-binding protein [Nocardia sp. PE-7]WKG08184.1 ATP-binding protein [Nocardia sp. PE-7]
MTADARSAAEGDALNGACVLGDLREPNQEHVVDYDSLHEKRSAATVLVGMARERYEFGISDDDEPFARTVDGEPVVMMLRGSKNGLRQELARQYFDQTTRAAPAQALADALTILEGDCLAAARTALHLRVAEHGGNAFIDMGDADMSGIWVNSSSWGVYGRADHGHAPVLFRRTRLTGAFPMPQRGGDLTALWGLVNITESDRPLILAALVQALIDPSTPHPIVSLFAEQGSGKSSATRMLVSLVDPSPVPLRKPPKDAEGWVTAAQGSWVVAIDNLSTIPAWLSDSMCRAVTGDGDVRRALYTDGDLSVFSFRRCLIVNGIDLGAMAGDYAERSVVANLERIPADRRRSERELVAEWDRQYPLILGALLDLCVAVKRTVSSVELQTLPRMADYAMILAAVDIVLGTNGITRYADQARTLAVDTLDGVPFLAALRETVTEEEELTAAELLTKVTIGAESSPNWRKPIGWPKDARSVTALLKRNAPALRSAGWIAERRDRSGKANAVAWYFVPPLLTGDGGTVQPSSPGNVAALPLRRQTAGLAGKTVGGIEAATRRQEPGDAAGAADLTAHRIDAAATPPLMPPVNPLVDGGLAERRQSGNDSATTPLLGPCARCHGDGMADGCPECRVVDAAARIVNLRDIDGLSFGKIARCLNDDGIKPAKAERWTEQLTWKHYQLRMRRAAN